MISAISTLGRRRTAYLALRALAAWTAAVLLVGTFALQISLLLRLNDLAESNQRLNVASQEYLRETALCLTEIPPAKRTDAALEACIRAHLGQEKR